MRLSLRMLFWIVLAAAVAVGWGIEHRRADVSLAEIEHKRGWPFFRPTKEAGPSNDAIERRTTLSKLQSLSTEELIAHFHAPRDFEQLIPFEGYDVHLTELSNRRLVGELEEHYAHVVNGWREGFDFPADPNS